MIGNTWPAGYNFSDRRTLTRGGAAGDLAVRYSPGTGNEFLVQGGLINNQEAAVARDARVTIMTAAGAILQQLSYATALPAANTHSYPTNVAGNGQQQTGSPQVVSGTDLLEARLLAVSATEDAIFSVVLRCLNGDPTITEVNA